MANIEFHKYQGTGNDFVIVQGITELDPKSVSILCNRRFGIGADGVILMKRSTERDFDMLYYNSDGSKSFCGNGSRCAVQYANHMGWIGSQCSFSSNDGDHSAYIEDSLVFVRMHDVNDLEERNTDYIANTGSPHYLIFGSQIDQMEITHAARKIRYSDEFSSEGININYLENSGDLLKVRTYERGVEDETLSCGTGVTAAALVNFKKLEKDPGQHVQKIQTLGGELQVHFETDGTKFWNIVLAGPAEFVFRGRIEI